MSDATTIAMNFPRRDARDKLCGRTRYTIDRARPGMLHAALHDVVLFERTLKQREIAVRRKRLHGAHLAAR